MYMLQSVILLAAKKLLGDLFTPTFLSEHPLGDSIEGTGPEEGWVSIKISGKVQFSRCAEVGCLEDGLPICFSVFFLR